MAETRLMEVRMPREGLRDRSILASLHRLSRDGRSWIAAEAALAQAEAASDGRRIMVMLVLVGLVFGFLFAAVILLSLFVVALLAPHVGGLASAAGLLSLGLMIVAALICWRLWHMATQQFGLLLILKRWWSIALKGPEVEK
jgi:uncharacterized membrane protein YqjE